MIIIIMIIINNDHHHHYHHHHDPGSCVFNLRPHLFSGSLENMLTRASPDLNLILTIFPSSKNLRLKNYLRWFKLVWKIGADSIYIRTKPWQPGSKNIKSMALQDWNHVFLFSDSTCILKIQLEIDWYDLIKKDLTITSINLSIL